MSLDWYAELGRPLRDSIDAELSEDSQYAALTEAIIAGWSKLEGPPVAELDDAITTRAMLIERAMFNAGVEVGLQQTVQRHLLRATPGKTLVAIAEVLLDLARTR